MNSALSTLVDNLSEINICNSQEKEDKDIKVKTKIVNSKKTVITKCKSCNSKENQLLNDLTKTFPSNYKLRNKNTTRFILLLQKSVYPYEYMDSMDRFAETTLPNIENF